MGPDIAVADVRTSPESAFRMPVLEGSVVSGSHTCWHAVLLGRVIAVCVTVAVAIASVGVTGADVASAAPADPVNSQNSADSAGRSARGRYVWPLTPRPRIVRGFQPPAQRWLAGHRGVDLAAAAGTVVRSAGTGTVNFAGRVAGKPVVSVRHPDGIVTTYEPVAATVAAGDRVLRGSPLGTIVAGHPGCTSSCLHWGARRGAGSRAAYLDPRALVGAVRVRLKPVEQTRSS